MIRGKTVALVVCARILAGLQAGGMTICVNSQACLFLSVKLIGIKKCDYFLAASAAILCIKAEHNL